VVSINDDLVKRSNLTTTDILTLVLATLMGRLRHVNKDNIIDEIMRVELCM